MPSHDRRRGGDAALIAALAAGDTIRESAGKAGVSEATAHRRLRDPQFKQAVEQAKAEALGRAVARLSDAAISAVDRLVDLLGADSEQVQLGSARSILELGTKLRESLDLEQRLAALEERLAEQPGLRRVR